jgi:hypothetical protein
MKERLRQEDHEFEANLRYIVRPCLKNTQLNHFLTIVMSLASEKGGNL